MVEIIFESHATSLDNEKGLASGYYDVKLSEVGKRQAKELGERYKGEHFDAIFCSDLQRSYETAEFAFGDKFPIIKDSRLRECDYGSMTRKPAKEIELAKAKYIQERFPGGERYIQATIRMKSFFARFTKKLQRQKSDDHWPPCYSVRFGTLD